MQRIRPLFVLMLGIVPALFASACNRSPNATSPASAAAPALTRGAVVKIVRGEIQRALALRDWHSYANDIDEYTGVDAASLFSLSVLDRATATGNINAPVRVIVYADYECPYCKMFETETTSALRHKFSSRALFVYRFYPLEMHGKVAKAESVAGACVARLAGPDAFRRFTAAVFAKTGSNGQGTPEPLTALAAAALLGNHHVNDPKSLNVYYQKCTQGKLGGSLIASDASFKGVIGTPTIFVVNTIQHKAWRVAGAMPTWVFEALITNVAADRPGDSDWAVERHRASLTGLE